MVVKQVIEAIFAAKTMVALQWVAGIAGITAVMFLVRVLSRYLLIGVGRKVEFDTRMDLFRHLLAMPRSYFDVQQTGELMSRLTNDLSALRMMVGGGVMLLANVLFAYLTIVPLMARLSWRLTLMAFLLYPLVIGLMRVLSTRVKRLSHTVQDKLGELTAIAQENFSGISVIQSYAKEPEESHRFKDVAEQYFVANTDLVRTRALLYILIAMVSGLSILIALGEGGREVITRELTLSSFAAYMLYLERLSWPTVSFGWILSTIQQGIAAKERINAVLDAESTVTDEKADLSMTALPLPPLEVSHLTFAYHNPYSPESVEIAPPILQDVSFAVQPGEMVALVGPIGAGKSTLLNLMVRLYDPPTGAITLNGIPIERIPLTLLRQQVTLMPQNSFLFSDTLKANIALPKPDVAQQVIESVAEMANLHADVALFPKAYETLVGERGVTLSGGQRQRTALARTLLAAPGILLLDDPFSNVDVETEAQIIQALQERRFLKDRTTIFASQRFSLVQHADRIIVLTADGRVDAIGTHEELLQRSALYRALCHQPEGDASKNASEEISRR